MATKVIKQKVFLVEHSEGSILVEADSFTEAIDIIEYYYNNTPNFTITSICSYRPILKPISKTITHTLEVSL